MTGQQIGDMFDISHAAVFQHVAKHVHLSMTDDEYFSLFTELEMSIKEN